MNETEEKMLAIAREVGLDHLQLHGDEQPALVVRLERTLPVIKAVRARKSFRPAQLSRFKQASAILLDGFDSRRRGGTGRTFDWQHCAAGEILRADFPGGGLTPENVGEAIRVAKPYAVDVCSGVEKAPGRKDPARMRDLIRAVKTANGRKAVG